MTVEFAAALATHCKKQNRLNLQVAWCRECASQLSRLCYSLLDSECNCNLLNLYGRSGANVWFFYIWYYFMFLSHCLVLSNNYDYPSLTFWATFSAHERDQWAFRGVRPGGLIGVEGNRREIRWCFERFCGHLGRFKNWEMLQHFIADWHG